LIITIHFQTNFDYTLHIDRQSVDRMDDSDQLAMSVYLMTDIAPLSNFRMQMVLPALLIRLLVKPTEMVPDKIQCNTAKPGLRLTGSLELVFTTQGLEKSALKNIVDIVLIHNPLLNKGSQHLDLIT